MNKGFTLIELLVVIVIIALLISVAISTWKKSKEKFKLDQPKEEYCEKWKCN